MRGEGSGLLSLDPDRSARVGGLTATEGRFLGTELAQEGETGGQLAAGDIRVSTGADPAGGWVVHRMSQAPTTPSGGEWQCPQSGEGAAELVSPRPAPRQMQAEAPGRAGEPSGQGEEAPAEGLGRVIADEKMSEIAGVELTHPMAGASFTKSSWRCSTDFAEGGTSERDLRDEGSGPFHTGYRRGTGHRSKYGAEIPEVAGGHAAQAPALQGIEPFDKLRWTLTPSTLTGGCPRDWKTAWSCTANSRPWAMTVAIPS